MPKLDNHNLYKPNPGLSTVKDDYNHLQWGIQKDAGFIVGRSSFPVFFTADGHNVHLQDSARGRSIVIATKATEGRIPTDVHTMSIGKCQCEADIVVIPNNPQNIGARILRDPSVLKFSPMSTHVQHIGESRYSHYPFIFYYRRHKSFNAASFWLEETIWHDERTENEIFTAIKLAFVLGYREIFLGQIPKNNRVYNNLKLISRNCDVYGLQLFRLQDGPDEVKKVEIDTAYAKCIL